MSGFRWRSWLGSAILFLYGHVTPRMRGNPAARFGSLLNTARVAQLTKSVTAENQSPHG